MNVVVIGAGALGTYYGARLEEAGAKITFLVREKRAKQIKEHGLHVKSTQGDYSFNNPHVETDVNNISEVDLVFLSVKGYHLQGAIEVLKHLTKMGAHVLPILNGIEHITTLQNKLGSDAVIGGLSQIIATLDEKGHVIHSSPFHNLIFGPLIANQQDICSQFEKLLNKTTLTFVNSEHVLVDLWNKYMFINAFSGITTATNLPIGRVRENKETFKITEMILKEMKELANKSGVKLTNEHLEFAKENLLSLDADATSSMHQDRRKGLTLEVGHLHGGAIRLANSLGLNMPYTEAVYGIIKPFEK